MLVGAWSSSHRHGGSHTCCVDPLTNLDFLFKHSSCFAAANAGTCDPVGGAGGRRGRFGRHPQEEASERRQWRACSQAAAAAAAAAATTCHSPETCQGGGRPASSPHPDLYPEAPDDRRDCEETGHQGTHVHSGYNVGCPLSYNVLMFSFGSSSYL